MDFHNRLKLEFSTERKKLKTSYVPAYVIANMYITDAVAYRRY